MFTKARIILGFCCYWFADADGRQLLLPFRLFTGKSGIVVTGQIIDLSVHRSDDGTTYCPVVKYTDGQEEYVIESSYCSSGYHNARVTILMLFTSRQPDNAVIHSFGGLYGGAVILLGMGAVFALVGTLPLIIMYLRSKSGQRLLREGMPVKARFSEVILNTTININGRSPFQIVAQMHDTAANTVKLYYSHNIAFDPSPFINQEFVTVYVDKKNPDKYYMDISFLPKVK